MQRRKRLTRKEIAIYRGIFILVIVVASVIIVKGVVALASDGVKNGMKKIGVSMVQSFYLSVSASENHMFSYVAKEETSKDTLFASMAESFSINHYAMHQGKIILEDDEDTENENYEYEFAEDSALIAQGLNQELALEDEEVESEHKIVIDSELSELAEQENRSILNQTEDTLVVEYLPGNVEMLPEYKKALEAAKNGETLHSEAISVGNFIKSQYDMNKLMDYKYLVSNYYVVDESTEATKEVFDAKKLLTMNMSIKKNRDVPQILIYHTHASETYIDSKQGVEADTVVGAGTYLAELLTEMGYNVYHDTTAYDRKPDGTGNRNHAYTTALPGIQKILEENPSIEVIIDLHRDSGKKRVTTINGKDTAQIMLFNGLSRNQSGAIDRLENPYQQENLAFSLQTALVGRKLYPGLVVRNYLKNYRYNMHLRERSLLIELGTANNTVMEAYNAMEPLANILNQMLSNP
ncbi:MAG: stage II sporulation protein P [Clostridiales bacterium]|nr:stage II sporulation protein P [Clostridiales bacterium]